jgi:hypothetical protein
MPHDLHCECGIESIHEDYAIDRVCSLQKIAHQGTARCRTNTKIVLFKESDDHIPDIAVIINDENVLWLAHLRPSIRG